jgi:L-aspartate oxidase
MVSSGDTSVYLDLSGLDRDPHRLFPAISRICRLFSIDIARDPIPVRPGAHYMIGGVSVDHDGRTTLPGLWAVGECANSGMHGANRMGSNSLLEGLVLGERAGLLAATAARERRAELLDGPIVAARPEPPADVQLNVQDLTYSLKSLMWRQMGIERVGASIDDALAKLQFWTRALSGLLLPEVPAWELLNMLSVSHLAALGARERRESRGTHHRSDFQALDPAWRAHTTLRPILGVGEHGECIAAVELGRDPVAESALV